MSVDEPNRAGRKPESHLQTLDLLRGVAAVCVVLFHFSSRLPYGGLMYHGYLAVDFFFALSGYVLYKAYHSDIRQRVLPFSSFALMRLIRLMPLVILGNTLAAVIDLFRGGDIIFWKHAGDIVVVYILGCLLLPTFFKTSLEDTTYPLNGPIWSLFFELFANLIFFFAAKRAHFKLIAILICLFSLGLLLYHSLISGNVHFGPHVEGFWLAFPRVLFSFFIGALLNYTRFNLKHLGRWSCTILVIAVFAVPPIQSHYPSAMFDIAAISLIFPLIIAASVQHVGPHSMVAQVSGDISFPIYCIHYPMVRVCSALLRHFSFPVAVNVGLSVILTLIMGAASLILFRAYDKPARRMLTAKLLPSRKPRG